MTQVKIESKTGMAIPAVPFPPALFFFPESSLRETVSRRLMRCGRKIGHNKARAAGHCSLIPYARRGCHTPARGCAVAHAY